MPLDATLLSLLACPVDRQGLFYFEAEGALYNPRLKRRYAITNGVPVLLVDQHVWRVKIASSPRTMTA